mmetsp:Transcript_41238/g.76710  ORF Transcript_41238/g.76710 Transcript_41238/m.76710 type:complete len:334 (-) Transcript_41238:377-1378(-)
MHCRTSIFEPVAMMHSAAIQANTQDLNSTSAPNFTCNDSQVWSASISCCQGRSRQTHLHARRLGWVGHTDILLATVEGRELRVLLRFAARLHMTPAACGVRLARCHLRGSRDRGFGPGRSLLGGLRTQPPWGRGGRALIGCMLEGVPKLLHHASWRGSLLFRRHRRMNGCLQFLNSSEQPILLRTQLALLPELCLQLGAKALHLLLTPAHLCLQTLLLRSGHLQLLLQLAVHFAQLVLVVSGGLKFGQVLSVLCLQGSEALLELGETPSVTLALPALPLQTLLQGAVLVFQDPVVTLQLLDLHQKSLSICCQRVVGLQDLRVHLRVYILAALR